MQSFTFQSGIDDAPCAGASPSGILIRHLLNQQRRFQLMVDIVLRGTRFAGAARRQMRVYAVEGVARCHVAGNTGCTCGHLVRIPLDGNRAPSGAPLEPEPYDATTLQVLPVVNLERDIIVAPTLTPEQITQSGIPTPGEWVTTYTILS
jgi:hypothetical protein